jgi:glycosyltransferase involved in cell wall biosynthesis
VVPYFRMSAFIEDAVDSLLSQTYSPIEIIIVNDGSFGLDDRILGRLAADRSVRVATQPNSGLGAARNFGVRISRGRFIAFLDADNVFEPGFIDRAVDVLAADSDVAYVGCWSRYVDERGDPLRGSGIGYQPLSNASELLLRANVAGDAGALVRRSIYDRGFWYSEELTSYEDWDFYERLRRFGLYGHCIPERLMRYRVRDQSMLREVGLQESIRLNGELIAHRESSEVRWMSPNV